MTTVLFKVTEVGLKAAATAAEQGIKVKLTTFKVGDGVNYIPDGSETALKGSILYEDVITKYKDQADGTLLLTCTLSVQAGPFDFGEIGIYTEAGVLFALTAFPQLQTKYSSLGSNVNSTFTFNCQLKLGQSIAIFTPINSSSATPISTIMYVNTWADILPPSQLIDVRVKQLAVAELDSKGDYSTLVQTNKGGVLGWSVQSNFFALPTLPVIQSVSGDLLSITISSATWQAMVAGPVATTVSYAAGFSFVVESNNNRFRSASVSLAGSDVKITFTSALLNDSSIAVSSTFRLWINDSSLAKTAVERDLQLQITTLSSSTAAVDAGLQYQITTLTSTSGTTDTSLQTQIDSLVATVNTLTTKLTQGIPSGMIARWDKATIPTSWVICDGTNGTPDLRDKFVVGVGSEYALNSTGGYKDTQLVAHSHGLTLNGSTSFDGAHTHTYKTYGLGNNGLLGNAYTNYDWGYAQTGNPPNTAEGAHSHAINISGSINSAGVTATNTNLPPYYALYYIMKL